MQRTREEEMRRNGEYHSSIGLDGEFHSLLTPLESMLLSKGVKNKRKRNDPKFNPYEVDIYAHSDIMSY